jgi:hypothetical protein
VTCWCRSLFGSSPSSIEPPRRVAARARTFDGGHLRDGARHAAGVDDAGAHLGACDGRVGGGAVLRARGGGGRQASLREGERGREKKQPSASGRAFFFPSRDARVAPGEGKMHPGSSRGVVRTSPRRAVGGAEPALAQAFVPPDRHLIGREVLEVGARLRDLLDALVELLRVLRTRGGGGGEASSGGHQFRAGGVRARSARPRERAAPTRGGGKLRGSRSTPVARALRVAVDATRVSIRRGDGGRRGPRGPASPAGRRGGGTEPRRTIARGPTLASRSRLDALDPSRALARSRTRGRRVRAAARASTV